MGTVQPILCCEKVEAAHTDLSSLDSQLTTNIVHPLYTSD